MSLGVRAARPSGRPATRLLLARPGGDAPAPVDTIWRARTTGPAGDIALESAARSIRVSPIAAKADKALLGAIAGDETEAMREVAASPSDLSPVAGLLLALRFAGTDPVQAARLLGEALGGEAEPWEHKFLRRHFPTLQLCVQLAPGVPAVMGADREAVMLLHAEMLTTLGRHLEAVTLLTQSQLTPIVGLTLAATYLAMGQNEAVVSLTDKLENIDDVTALCLVARGVALRSAGRTDEAVKAFDRAIVMPNRHPGMVAAALGERASLLQAMGEELAALADQERILALEGGALPETLIAPAADESSTDLLQMDLSAPTDDSAMRAARSRVRRRIAMTGAPGTFGGRHHRTYQPEVEAMLAAGQLDAAESLLLGLLDAVEDEAEVDGVRIDATFYLTLADLFAHRGDRPEYLAVMERFDAAGERFGLLSDAEDLSEATNAVDKHDGRPTVQPRTKGRGAGLRGLAAQQSR